MKLCRRFKRHARPPIVYLSLLPKAMRAAGFVVEAPRHAESAALLALLAV